MKNKYLRLIFGIIGVELLSGRMGYCEGAENYYGVNFEQVSQTFKIYLFFLKIWFFFF